ncbi:MAG TPA: O-antigen polymerase, partial [Longimicrobiaceae bacterium]|nr:O-antigen polymerase [Longimicrobiaceae bacterium]
VPAVRGAEGPMIQVAGGAMLPAGAGRPEPAPSPFVHMPGRYRTLLAGFFVAYLLAVATVSFFTRSGSALIVLALGLFIALRLVPLLAWRREYGWFHPLVFGILVTALELLRSFTLYAWGLDRHVALPGHDADQLGALVAYELLLSSFGLVAYYIGYWLFPVPPLAKVRFTRPPSMGWKAVGAVVFSGLVLLYFLRAQGGLVNHLMSWGQGRAVSLAGEGYWLPLMSTGALSCLIWLAVQPNAIRSPLLWACMTASAAVLYLYNGSRTAVVYLLIIGLIAWMLAARRIAYTRVLLAAVMGLFLIGALGEVRKSTWTGTLSWTGAVEVGFGETMRRVVTGELVERNTTSRGSLPVLARVPDEVPLVYGNTYLAVLALPVPRKLWPGKPGLVDGRVGRTFFGYNYGIPIGPVAEAVWNFHVPGVFIVFLLFGVLHRWMARAFVQHAASPAVYPVYAILLWMLASPTSMGLVATVTHVVPILGLLLLFGGIRKAQRRTVRWGVPGVPAPLPASPALTRR